LLFRKRNEAISKKNEKVNWERPKYGLTSCLMLSFDFDEVFEFWDFERAVGGWERHKFNTLAL
jgi:hypothetical protein